MKFYVAIFFGATIVLVSCKKDAGSNKLPAEEQSIAPNGFNFSTSRQISIDLRLLTNDNMPLAGVVVNVYASPTDGEGKSLLSAVSDKDGSIKAVVSIPSYLEQVYIDPAYIGLLRNAKAVINGSTITGVIGGDSGFGGDIVANDEEDSRSTNDAQTGRSVTGRSTQFLLPSFDINGRPKTLYKPSDVISSSLLSYINASLPENKPVPQFHPDYLNADAVNDLNIVKKADVWVTFVSEGAGYYNTLGYYTYATKNPPATQADISKINIIIPNASLGGSGGGMLSGDKIWLGRFSPDTSIGFVLLQNAWSPSSKTINTSARKFFTHDYLNTSETDERLRRHAVSLYDSQNQLFLTGFEDLTRTGGSSDEDFNDLIFYTTSNPVDAISTRGINLIDKPIDSDGDGVSDVYDKFPKDATRAYRHFYPAEYTWGTLSFEDQWPSTGDYDVNDMVVGFRYQYIKNAQNNTVEMYADYSIRAIGATFINGLGVQLPITNAKVKTVTGQRLIANYIRTGTNGAEAGQTNAVIIPFDDTRALQPSGGFINVVPGSPYVHGDTARLYIAFSTPLSATEMPADIYNPFLISNQRRGYEVHLAGYKPTDKADPKLLGTMQDNSSVSINRYYLSAKNWPWALSFVEEFDYPVETNAVSSGYLNFLTWAQSGGIQKTDWYKDLIGYRNMNLLFRK